MEGAGWEGRREEREGRKKARKEGRWGEGKKRWGKVAWGMEGREKEESGGDGKRQEVIIDHLLMSVLIIDIHNLWYFISYLFNRILSASKPHASEFQNTAIKCGS